MKPITAEEWELLNFFEVEPELRDPDVVWMFNDAAYSLHQDGIDLSVAIAPSYRDLRIILRCGQRVLFELNAMSVGDVRVRTEKRQSFLEVVVDDDTSVRVEVRPSLKVTVSSHR